MKIKNTPGVVIFNVFNTLFMIVMVLICFYPIFHVILASFSEPSLLIQHSGIMLAPRGFSTVGYEAVLKNQDIYTGYVNTIFYVVAGCILSLLCVTWLAYTLSRKNMKYRKQIMIFVTITMFFSGGMVPTYLVVKACGLLNTRMAVILPVLMNVYNLIIVRTAFLGIPESLIEAATIDGANDFEIWLKVAMPLAKATIAVFVLFTGVNYWNAWFNAMIYLNDRKLFPLQLFLREILVSSSTDSMIENASAGQSASLEEVIKYATIVIATIPILCIYPFLQKYFVNGVMVGAVKG